MVVINMKLSDGDGFMFETTTDTPNDQLIESLVAMQNLRVRSQLIVNSVKGLAQYGPAKEPNAANSQNEEKGPNYNADPTGARIGYASAKEQHLKILLQTAQDLEEYVDKAQVKNRMALNKSFVLDKISNVRGAVVMAYPKGLPENDLVKISLDNENLDGTSLSKELLDPQTTSLWCAGKEFQKDKKVSDRLGTNEKSKVIAKFQTVGSGAPAREPVVNEEERNAMMAHYFKRNEEMKRLAEANDDDYLNSQWADSKEMKRNLQGLESIKAPGMRFS